MSEPVYGSPSYRRAFPLEVMNCPWLLLGGVSLSSVPLRLPEHAHAGFELHFIESGAMTQVLAEGQELQAHGGDVLLTQAGVRHQGVNGVIAASKHIWMVVDPLADESGSLLGKAGSLALDLKSGGNKVFPAKDLLPSYRQILNLFKQCDRQVPYAMQRLSLACVDFLMAFCHLIRDDEHAPQQAANQATLNAIAIIQNHLSDPLSVQELAQAVELSPSRFHELFLRDSGETPAAFYLRLRCHRAAELIHKEQNRPFAEIAAELGFSDQRYFSSCFKRVFGMTPSLFRRLQHPQYES